MGNKPQKDRLIPIAVLIIAALVTSLALHYFVFMPLVFPDMVGIPSE